MTDKELIQHTREIMAEIHTFNNGKLVEYEQNAYNCLRMLSDRLEIMSIFPKTDEQIQDALDELNKNPITIPAHLDDPNRYLYPQTALLESPGISRRDYFAAMALNGIVSGGWYEHLDSIKTKGVQHAVELADALISELDKTQQP